MKATSDKQSSARNIIDQSMLQNPKRCRRRGVAERDSPEGAMADRGRPFYDNYCLAARQEECGGRRVFTGPPSANTMDVANVTPSVPSSAPDIVGYLNFASGNF